MSVRAMRRALGALAVAAVLSSPALAEEPGEPEDVRTSLATGTAINWTTLSLEVTASARGTGIEAAQRATEQRARQQVGPGLLDGAWRVPLSAHLTVSDLESDPVLGPSLRSRVSRWSVTETRYYASGRVELVGELPLRDLVRPWTLSTAIPLGNHQDDAELSHSGLLIDARGLGARPVVAPRLLNADGEVLHDGALKERWALDEASAIYVLDPAHPATTRIGDAPLIVRAVGTTGRGADLRIETTDPERVRELARRGRVVIVVD